MTIKQRAKEIERMIKELITEAAETEKGFTIKVGGLFNYSGEEQLGGFEVSMDKCEIYNEKFDDNDSETEEYLTKKLPVVSMVEDWYGSSC